MKIISYHKKDSETGGGKSRERDRERRRVTNEIINSKVLESWWRMRQLRKNVNEENK